MKRVEVNPQQGLRRKSGMLCVAFTASHSGILKFRKELASIPRMDSSEGEQRK